MNFSQESPLGSDNQNDDNFIVKKINNYPSYRDHSQSRSEIQQQIAQFPFPPHESFDISSFAESRTAMDIPARNIRQKFPLSNAPTLNPKLNQVGDNFEVNKNNGQQREYQNKLLLKRISDLQEQNAYLKGELSQKDEQFDKLIRKIKQMTEINLNMEQEMLKKQQLNDSMQRKIKGYKQKYEELIEKFKKSQVSLISQSKISNQQKIPCTRTHLESKSNNFSPELLSPDECVRIFIELILKLEKSYKLHKKLAKETKVRQILSKIIKNQ